MLVYEALATLNRDFEQTLRDLNQLEELSIFPHRWQRKFVKTWRATLEETRAWASFEVLEVLHRIEEREWVRFGRIRQLAEKQSESDGIVAPSESNPAEDPPKRLKKASQSGNALFLRSSLGQSSLTSSEPIASLHTRLVSLKVIGNPCDTDY